MNPGVTTLRSILDKPLHELAEEDISQLSREDCREYLKEKGMRRPPWNKSPALLETSDGSGAAGVLRKITVSNPKEDPPSIKSFSTRDEVDAWLYSNPMRCPEVLNFVETNATTISYGLQSISSLGHYEDPTFKFQIPLQIAAEHEIARSLIGDPNFNWDVRFKEFAHPAVEEFSVVGGVGPTFFLAIAMFGFVFQISSLITEKELKPRQAMTMMGLYDSTYWLSWLTWAEIITIISSLFIILYGMMFQFDFILNNSLLVVFLLFFIFQLNRVDFYLFIYINKPISECTSFIPRAGL